MPMSIDLPAFAPDQPPARVDAGLCEALSACDRAQECAVLWFAEVQRRGLYREFGCASLEIYATASMGFSQNRYWQFKRLADDLERLPVLKEAVATGELGWTKAQQVARLEALLEKARKARCGTAGASRLELVIEAVAGMVEGAPGAAVSSRPGVQVVVQQCPDCAAAPLRPAGGRWHLRRRKWGWWGVTR